MNFVSPGKEENRQVSLAQEMSEAEKHPYPTGIGMLTGNYSGGYNGSGSYNSGNINKHNSYVPVSSEGNSNSNTTSRPIFILKFSNGMPMGNFIHNFYQNT